MERVPIERLERIKRSLTDETLVPRLLEGLVAVFSKTECDDLLLVYVNDPPALQPPGGTAITLDDLAGANLLPYDGPIVGFAAIDHIRWDIPTKGPEFYRLDRFLRRQGRATLLHRSWTDLADYLRSHLDEIASSRSDQGFVGRATAEIAAISAPRMIASLPAARLREMVAFVPERNHAICLDETSLDDMAGLDLGPAEHVIALEEVRPIVEAAAAPEPQARYPLELRTVLKRSDLDAELAHTLGALALAFHRRWERTGILDDRWRAYALALELHLAKGDVDDLSAVLPDGDFQAFLRDGAGTYVYRRPIEDRSDRSAAGIHRLSLDEARAELTKGTWPVTFSLLPLQALLSSAGSHWSDLGPVLRKLARTEILARNAWLLTQDFLDSRERRSQFEVSLESLLETMTHCCAILSLTDPWRARQGRRNEWLLEAYGTLHRVLATPEQAINGARRGYYEALADWYGCAFADRATIVTALERMTGTLRAVEARSSHDDEPDPVIADQARSLMRLGAALLNLFRGGGQAERYAAEDDERLFKPTRDSVPRVIRRATDMAQPLDVVSEPFRASFQQYATIDTARRIRASQIPVQDKIERLKHCVDQLRQGRRLVFADYHLARILSCLYDRAIHEAEEWADELQVGASLDVVLRTSSVVPHEESGIVFAVSNAGRAAARDVEVELEGSEDFELLDQSFKQTLSVLGAEQERSFRFSVRSHTGMETFSVRCKVSSYDQRLERRQQRAVEFQLLVTNPESGRFRPKPNPYVFGLPLQQHRQFYGRRSELKSLLSHLAIRRPQNILLRGPRRTGKTSLLYMVQAVLTDEGGRSGVRSWFDIPEDWNSALDSAVPVMLDLQAIEWRNETPTPTGFYQAILGKLRDAGLRSDFGDLILEEPSVTGTQFVKALSQILQSAGGARPVVLVDEFDVLDRIAEKSFFYGPLRHVISTVQGVTWVVASALGLYNEVRDYESPLFNVFKIVTLSRLDPAAARRLIRSPWQPDDGGRTVQERPRLHFMDDAVEAILEEAGLYPYFIQLLCSEIVEYVNATRTNHVRHQTVYQVIERRIVPKGSAAYEHFAFLWDRAGGLGKLILVALLRNPDAMTEVELKDAALGRLRSRGPAIPSLRLDDFDDTLERLKVVDAVRDVRGVGYVFGIPLFRRLLLERDEHENLEDAAFEALEKEQATESRSG